MKLYLITSGSGERCDIAEVASFEEGLQELNKLEQRFQDWIAEPEFRQPPDGDPLGRYEGCDVYLEDGDRIWALNGEAEAPFVEGADWVEIKRPQQGDHRPLTREELKREFPTAWTHWMQAWEGDPPPPSQTRFWIDLVTQLVHEDGPAGHYIWSQKGKQWLFQD